MNSMYEFFLFSGFVIINATVLFCTRCGFRKFKNVWVIPLFMLFAYFVLNLLLHENSDLLNSCGTPEYREYLSDVLISPMIIFWSVILGAVFFSRSHNERKSQHSYSVQIIEKRNEL